jgi:hypothetical protein
MIDWGKINTSREDLELIHSIAVRAAELAEEAGVSYTLQTAAMDLEVVHAREGLRLRELLAADRYEFGHDVFGIRRNLDRDTGELRDFFSPRFTDYEMLTVEAK